MERQTSRRRRLEGLALVLGAAALLLPFADKPIHLDEPLFLAAARQALRDPAHVYGFEINWTGRRIPFAEETQNPPLVPFYLAALGGALGFGEVRLHLGMLLPSALAVLGMHALAARLCARPAAATLIAVASPAFLVSATTLMADVPMLALFCWAMALWIDGIERRHPRRLAAAGGLAALCFLAKFAGAALVPLFLAHGALRRRRPGTWLLALLLPLAAMAAFEVWQGGAPGGPGLLRALRYSGERRELAGTAFAARLGIGLSFLGGCFLPALLLAPRLWGRRALGALGAAALALAVALAAGGRIGPLELRGAEGLRLAPLLELAIFAVGGAQLLVLAALELRWPRSAGAGLLALWLAGIVAFASFVNWTINARSFLPAAPAVGILLARRLEHRRSDAPSGGRGRDLAALVPALALALAVAWADYRFARAARDAAFELTARHGSAAHALWFEGAWGFQYYAEQRGAQKVDRGESVLAPGDGLIRPRLNSDVGPPPPPEHGRLLEVAHFPAASFVASIEPQLGAGFYSDLWGPLPFAFGRAPAHAYAVYRVLLPIRLGPDQPPPSAMERAIWRARISFPTRL